MGYLLIAFACFYCFGCLMDHLGLVDAIREEGFLRGVKTSVYSFLMFWLFGPVWWIVWAFVLTQLGVIFGL